MRGGSTIIRSAVELTAYGEYPAIQGNGDYAGSLSVEPWSTYKAVPQVSAPNSDMAIYWPQNDTLNIEQGVFTGKTAIWAKSGTITISGGKFIANGAKVDYVANNNGANATGDAVVIETSANAAYETPTVKITGGIFESENAQPIAVYGEGKEVKGFVDGGYFNKTLDDDLVVETKAQQKVEEGDMAGYWTVKKYITVTMKETAMKVGETLPADCYDINWNLITENSVEVTVVPTIIDAEGNVVTEITEAGEYTITATATLSSDEYMVKVVDGKLTVEKALFNLYGANIVAGNTLDMYFYVLSDDLEGREDYYAVIKRTMEDGTVIEKNIPYEKWESYSKGTMRRFILEGIASKEMTDKITVEVFFSDGTPASEVWNDSIKDYAMRTIVGTSSDKQRITAVDMLNYGAAAQKYFGYRTNDLANADLGEYAKYATTSIDWSDERIQGVNYMGTSVVGKSNLQLVMYFENITTDMYAIATYTDHYNEAHEIRIEGSDFYVRSEKLTGVIVDTLVIADGGALVTVKVYDAEGNEVANASDSIISYAYRGRDGDEVYTMMARFCASAYAYFQN